MYMAKITADADWQIFLFITFENESDVDYIMRKRGIKGILFARYEDTRLEENAFWNIVKTMNLKH